MHLIRKLSFFDNIDSNGHYFLFVITYAFQHNLPQHRYGFTQLCQSVTFLSTLTSYPHDPFKSSCRKINYLVYNT